jgi:hypothetical protein
MKSNITRSQFIGSSIGLSILSSTKLFGSFISMLLEPNQETFSMNDTMKTAYNSARNYAELSSVIDIDLI